MSIQTSAQETINTLNAIFEKHKNERICVLATICCGKTTLLKQIPDCVDLDDELWPQLTTEELLLQRRPQNGIFIHNKGGRENSPPLFHNSPNLFLLICVYITSA